MAASRVNIHEVFVASSVDEFDRERHHLGADVLAVNDAIVDGGEYVRLNLCEDLSKAMDPVRKQDEYDRLIARSELVILIAGRRVGRYTVEELETALEARADDGAPRIVAFVKETEPDAEVEEGGRTMPELLAWLDEADVRVERFSTLEDLDRLLLGDELFSSLLPEGFEL